MTHICNTNEVGPAEVISDDPPVWTIDSLIEKLQSIRAAAGWNIPVYSDDNGEHTDIEISTSGTYIAGQCVGIDYVCINVKPLEDEDKEDYWFEYNAGERAKE